MTNPVLDPAITPPQSPVGALLKKAVIPVVAGAVIASVYFLWEPGRLGQTEPCVGMQIVSGVAVRDSSTLFLIPLSGFNHRKVTMGPACIKFEPTLTKLIDSGVTKLCVGDQLNGLAARDEAGDCKITEIKIVKDAKS